MQQEHVVLASDATLTACSASLAHALQELWRARVCRCSQCLAGSDPFTISTMPGPQESHTGIGERLRDPVSRGIAKCHNPAHPGLDLVRVSYGNVRKSHSQSVSLTHLQAWRTGPHAHTRCTRLAREPTRGTLSPALAPGPDCWTHSTQLTGHWTAHEVALYSGVLRD